MFTKNSLPESIPCFLCGSNLDIRIDKKDHPYFICDHCGIQTFVRGSQGIQKLSALSEDDGLRLLEEGGSFSKRAEIQNLRFEIETLEKELRAMPLRFPWESPSERENLLKSKIEGFQRQLTHLLEK